jgi:hypothetical protein
MNGERAMVLGAVLGLLDTIVIAAGIAAWKHGMYPSVFPAVITLGMMPALVVGIGVGYLAAESTARSIAWRRRMMAAPAIAGVALLGIAFGLQVIVPLAAIPTVVGVLVLERATREPDALPVAAARVRW